MFQFTHPGKGATYMQSKLIDAQAVSIHAPWEGCDSCTLVGADELGVSIHAPWEGCDLKNQLLFGQGPCFNSRTLGRVRPQLHILLAGLFCFNSRTLGRVRLAVIRSSRLSLLSFNSRTLGRVRQLWFYPFLKDKQFQFTHPGKGATLPSLSLWIT